MRAGGQAQPWPGGAGRPGAALRVRLGITAFGKPEWARLERALAGSAWYSAKLLAGEMPYARVPKSPRRHAGPAARRGAAHGQAPGTVLHIVLSDTRVNLGRVWGVS